MCTHMGTYRTGSHVNEAYRLHVNEPTGSHVNEPGSM